MFYAHMIDDVSATLGMKLNIRVYKSFVVFGQTFVNRRLWGNENLKVNLASSFPSIQVPDHSYANFVSPCGDMAGSGFRQGQARVPSSILHLLMK